MRTFLMSAAAAIFGVAAIMVAMGGCYPRPPVDPPTCAEDPTQEWCVPPPFAKAPDGGAPGCRPVRFRKGRVVASCDDGQPVSDHVDLVVDATGRTWSTCAWNSCGRDPSCRAKLFPDGGAR